MLGTEECRLPACVATSAFLKETSMIPWELSVHWGEVRVPMRGESTGLGKLANEVSLRASFAAMSLCVFYDFAPLLNQKRDVLCRSFDYLFGLC